MALIEKLVERRLDNFIKEFDIDMNCFSVTSTNNTIKINWHKLTQKLIEYGHVTNHSHTFNCYYVIKNIVWKNILFYDITNEKIHLNMYHNNYQIITPIFRYHMHTYPFLSREDILNRNRDFYSMLIDNCTKLQTKIINYIMLLDILVTEYMINDLAYIFKMYIFDVMLIL